MSNEELHEKMLETIMQTNRLNADIMQRYQETFKELKNWRYITIILIICVTLIIIALIGVIGD